MEPTERSRVRRLPERASYERADIDAVLDEGLVAHVGFSVDEQPFVLPMVYARRGDQLLLHASVASRLARHLAAGAEVCVTVTLLDALVLARSAFHHSMNYRSVVVLGRAERVTDPAELEAGFAALVDHVVPGRAAETRPPNRSETRQTMLLALPLAEASLKRRTGGPVEEPDDLDLPAWGGVLPLATVAGPPEPDGQGVGVPVPDHVARWARPAPGFGSGGGSR